MKAFAPDCAAAVYPLLLKLVFRGSEAIGLKGGLAVKFWKGKGEKSDVASYRQILLASNVAKCMHQALRPAIREVFVHSSPSLQIGGKPGGNVVFGAHITRTFLRWQWECKRSCFILFTDIASAFYSVVRQLVASSGSDQDSSVSLAGLGLPAADLEMLVEHIKEPSALTSAGAEPWLEAVAHRLTDATWFVMQHDSIPVQTSRGTRPGSSWADILFSVVVRRIVERRDAVLAQLSGPSAEIAQVPYDHTQSLAPSAGEGAVPLTDLIWADDIATMRVVRLTATLPRAIRNVTGVSCDSFAEFGFRLSFGRNKTATLAQPAGQGARAIRKQLFGKAGSHGRLRALREHDAPVETPLVPEYRHLGAQIAVSGRMGSELSYRIAQARAAYKESRRKVFRAPGIAVKRKAFILKAFVLPRLLFGAGSWPPLTRGEQQQFSGTLWSFYRQMLCIPRDGCQNYSFATILALVGLPGPDVTLHVQRLTYLGSLFRSAPPELWALIKLDRPYALQMMDSARWLFKWVWNTSTLPNPDTDWEAWRAFLISSPAKYKGWLQRAQGLEIQRSQVVAALEGLYSTVRMFTSPATQADINNQPCSEICIPCRKLFRTRVAWSCHAQKIHQYRTEAYRLRKKTQVPLCQGCGKVYSNLNRLQRHLAYSVDCVQQWGAFVPEAEAQPDIHPQAPPEQTLGVLHDHIDATPVPGISESLLQELHSVDPADEANLWDLVSAHISPLQTLRDTVSLWSQQADSHEAAASAENLLLLLDPELLGDTPAKSTVKPALPAAIEGVWPDLPFQPVQLPGLTSSVDLVPPPPVVLPPSGFCSIPLRHAVEYATWLEQACACIARCLNGGTDAARTVHCPGIEQGLGPAAGWLKSIGATFSSSGVYFLSG